MKRLIAGLFGLALAALTGQAAQADAFEDILKKGVVRIATPLDVPPMGSQNEKREAEGFLDWAKGYLDRLSKQVADAKQVSGERTAQFEEINLIAHELRGQILPLRSIMNGLGIGLLLAGGLLDRIGVRLGYTIAVGVKPWSASAHSTASNSTRASRTAGDRKNSPPTLNSHGMFAVRKASRNS